MKNTLCRTLLASALALAALPALAQSGRAPFSQTVFFGDSLTDAGFFRPFLIQTQGPQAALVGQFTTNPGFVWSQYLAETYGTGAAPAWGLTTAGVVAADGSNYAAGGATFNAGPGFPPAPPTQYAPTIPTQVAAYLSRSGGTADARALYTVWGGANDLFFHLNGATSQAQFLGAAGIQVSVIDALSQAGAKYILVPNLPDVGHTPFGMSQGAAGSAGISALVQAYNQTLFGGLAAAGLRVIPVDTYGLIGEIYASPAAYGFANVTTPACFGVPSSLVCSPLSTVPGGADSHAFADAVHPTPAAHKVLAELATSVIEGPRLLAILPHSASVIGRARAEQVANHVAGKPQADGLRWWGGLRGDNQRYAGGDLYDGAAVAGTFGVDWSRGNLVYGAYAGLGRGKLDFGLRRGDFRQTDASLGGFVGWYGERAWVNGQLGYTRLSFDVNREVRLGSAVRHHQGSPDGSNLGAGISAGYEFGEGRAHHGPVASLLAQRIKLDGYAESNPGSSALSYPDQDLDSLVGGIGWQARYRINDHVEPYARLTFEHEFEDQPEEAFATVQTLATTGAYAVPGLGLDRSRSKLRVGARARVFGLDADVGIDADYAQKGGHDLGVYLGLSGGF